MTVRFDIWGCRGSRNYHPGTSAIGNLTSCYSISHGEAVCAVDAGRGLAALSTALHTEDRFASVRQVHVVITHAHMDHWEGLKDADWFWSPDNGLEVTIYGSTMTLDTIERGFAPPAFVPLGVLALGKLQSFASQRFEIGDTLSFGDFTVRTHRLNHFSGDQSDPVLIDTAGMVIDVGGARIAYLCDHQPGAETIEVERAMIEGADLVVFDAHFANIADHTFGHGSQEYAARIARAHTGSLVLAAHHGPRSDEELTEGLRAHAAELDNVALAREGDRYVWLADRRCFARS